MISVDFWDEISGEWGHADLDIPADSTPETIIKAVDAAISEPLGFIPSEEIWHLKSSSLAGPILTIECRTSRNHLGIILVNLEEDRSDQPHHKPSEAHETHKGSSV